MQRNNHLSLIRQHAAVTPHRPPAAARLARVLTRMLVDTAMRVQVRALLWRASSTRRYLAECDPDGLVQSLNVRRFNAEATADEQRAHELRAHLATTPPSTGDALGPLLGLLVILAPWLILAAVLF